MIVPCNRIIQNFNVFGYSRTKMNDEELRNMISTTLTCRVDKRYGISTFLVLHCLVYHEHVLGIHLQTPMFSRENCEDKMNKFLKRCFYHSGLYNSEEDFAELDRKLKEREVLPFFTNLLFI